MSDPNGSRKSDDYVLSFENLNRAVKNVEYAVRGRVVTRAAELEKKLKNGASLPFDCVIRANDGDSHAVGQKPITFFRQVLAACTYPDLIERDFFPVDVRERAKRMLGGCDGRSVGSYSDTAGLPIVRKDIAGFIQRRDGIECDPENIFLTKGACLGIKLIMQMLVNDPGRKKAGFMVPIPQYPLYGAIISEYSSEQIGYNLDEDNNWALNIDELERAYQESLPRCEPKAICIINPGNPTGQVLSLENMQAIIKWAYEKRLFILADEVYQDNIYPEGVKFHSFKKVASQLGHPYSNIEMASFYSISKGFMGECGLRAGFFEIINMNPKVKVELKKMSTVQLCSSIIGQICMSCVVNQPQPGEPSYDLFIKEKTEVLEGLREKARLVTELLNKIEGIKCNPVQGALYAFPKITLPQKVIDHAKSLGIEPDMFYCLELIEHTGICVGSGSVFCQRPGTYHFRMTILPPVDQIKSMIARLETFHIDFVKKWS